MTATRPSPPRLLLFGATSAVGGYLLPLLSARGWPVSAVTRQDTSAWRERFTDIDWIQAHLSDAPQLPATVTHVLSLGPCDAFVDWLKQQTPGGCLRQIIAFGSTSADTKIDSPAAAERALADSLQRSQVELCAQSDRLAAAWTLLRPTLIYGGCGDVVARIAAFAARWHVHPRPLGAIGRALRQPVHAADLAAATLNCIDRAAACNRRFDLAGAERLTLAALLSRAAHARTRFSCPLPLPLPALLHLAKVLRVIDGDGLDASAAGRLARDQVFDIASAHRALDFTPQRFVP